MLIKYTRSTAAKWYPQRCHWRIDVQRDKENIQRLLNDDFDDLYINWT